MHAEVSHLGQANEHLQQTIQTQQAQLRQFAGENQTLQKQNQELLHKVADNQLQQALQQREAQVKNLQHELNEQQALYQSAQT